MAMTICNKMMTEMRWKVMKYHAFLLLPLTHIVVYMMRCQLLVVRIWKSLMLLAPKFVKSTLLWYSVSQAITSGATISISPYKYMPPRAQKYRKRRVTAMLFIMKGKIVSMTLNFFILALTKITLTVLIMMNITPRLLLYSTMKALKSLPSPKSCLISLLHQPRTQQTKLQEMTPKSKLFLHVPAKFPHPAKYIFRAISNTQMPTHVLPMISMASLLMMELLW
mmetsp:Transcript_13566/g.27731  ORF Transcript_13566/g.27731 Transcript_13566/m.27731 type:complete len:223 (-) Transcript_13566:1647-2315(-)